MSSKLYAAMKERFLKVAADIHLDPQSRVVVFSDLHMGDGRSHDDFSRNGGLFQKILREYYFSRGYTLILNGDIEELLRYQHSRIRKTWGGVYDIFDHFHREGRLYKIAGNHDSKLFTFPITSLKYPLLDAVRLEYRGHDILVFHGHQMSPAYDIFHNVMEFFLRYVANTLRIPNRSTAHSSHRRWKIESRTYEFSRQNKMLSIIGHTHRPLFESMAKTDILRYEIENLCRLYASGEMEGNGSVKDRIKELKHELEDILRNRKEEGFVSQLYSSEFLIPCLFNAGCVIGKRGITGIEIQGDTIALVHWQSDEISPRYSQKGEEFETPIPGEPHVQRRVTKTDDLRYVFSRIHLLG